MKRKIFGILFALVLALSLTLVTAVPAAAAPDVTVTDATGGDAISADTAADATSPAWTDLEAITIAEQDAADIAVQTGATLVLKAPSGFQFNDTQAPSISGVAGDITALSIAITASEITVTLTATGTATMDTIIIGATPKIQVQPTTGMLPADGQIYRPTTTGGNAVIAGIETTDDVDGDPDGTATNFGTLGMVAGSANKLAFEANPGGSVSGEVFGIQPTIEAQDQFGNIVDTFADDITISVETGPGALDIGAATQAMTNGTLTTDGLGYTATADQEDFTLAANDSGPILTEGVSGTVTCDVVATKLVFTTQPAGSVSGVALVTQPIVEAQDAGNLLDTDYVTGVIASENDLGTLAGTLTVTPALGIATFTDLVYTATANGEIFQIDVASGTLTGATSADVVSVIPTWGGGGWVPPTPTIETNLFGKVSRFRFHITTRGEIRDTIQATSADGNLSINIPAGTIALDKNGNPLSTLTSDIDVSPPPPPSHIIGLAYNFGPDGATFDPAITLTWSYDPDALPEGVAEEDLVILWYDEEAGEWVECDFTCAPETDCITARVCHFTTFAIIAHPAPADFSVSNLSIQPSEVQPKEAVTITLSVANTGDMEGSYAVVLKINGVKEAEKDVTVAAGSSQSVSFSVTREKAGSYSVAVNGLSGSFTVKEPVPTPAPPPTSPPPAPEAINWPLVGGIIAAVVVVGLLIFFLVVRRRA